ncbi:unnamed protein product [Mucor hiemalis]
MPRGKPKRLTLTEVPENTDKREKENPPTIRVLKRKEFYLVTTLLYIPKGLITVREKSTILDLECQPQLFSNDRKAKDYMKEKAEKLKNILLEEGSYIAVADEDGVQHAFKKHFSPENFTTYEHKEELIILGFEANLPFQTGEYWAFLKWHAVVLNNTLPPNVQGIRRSKQRITKPSASSSTVLEKEV